MQKKLLPYLILTLFALFGCENENFENGNSPELNTNQSTKAKIDNLSIDELSKDKQFDEISNVFKLDETFATAKNAETKKQTLDNSDFEIDFSSVNKYESPNGVSYTFLIKNNEENSNHFENFVVEKHNDGTVNGFIVYYEYSQRYLDSLNKGIVIPFDGTLRRTANKEKLDELKKIFKEGKTAKSSTTAKSTGIVCVETRYFVQSLCPSGVHLPGKGPCEYANNGPWYGYSSETKIDCTDGSNPSNTWGWVADSKIYTSTVPAPYSSSGGSSSSTATVQPNLFDDVSLIQRFVKDFGLTGNEIEWARYRPNRNKVNNFMEETDYSPATKVFVKEMISTSLLLNVDAISIWNDYERFKNQMSDSEKVIFDNLLPNRKLWYMCAAKKALDKANELFPNSVHNGTGDAFRHALWNGISSLLIGNNLAEQLTTAHESKPAPPNDPFNYKEVEMDLYNNNKGRQIAMISNISNITANVLKDLSNGYLRYLNNLDSNTLATYNSTLIPTNK